MKQIKVTLPEIDGVELKSAKVDLENRVVVCEYGERYIPKDGDIVYCKLMFCNYSSDFIYICKEFVSENTNKGVYIHAGIDASGELTDGDSFGTHCIKVIRPATDKEAKRLFDLLEEDGKRWNAEKRCVEDIELKKGQILRWGGIGTFVGIVIGKNSYDPRSYLMFDPKRENPKQPNSCHESYLSPATESEKQQCLEDLKKIGKMINESGDIVDIPIEIKEGDLFECIEDVIMTSGTKLYSKGKIYVSHNDGYLTNDKGYRRHELTGEFAKKHFKKVGNIEL